MKISAQFATSLRSAEHIVAAEQLGYDRAWLFDTPHESPDVWMMLALAAERTTWIGLGPGVLVPSLRHPMVNASATAALEALAPGRVAVAFGTGFAGARALGAAPTTWPYLRDYVAAFRALLAGATVLWQGARMQMMHPDGHAPERPIDVPILISALGPKGLAVATELADGLFTVNGQTASQRGSIGPHLAYTAPSWPTMNPWARRGCRRLRGRETHWPTTPPTNSAATSPPCRPATCGLTPSTPPHRRIATSPCMTSTSSRSTAPTPPPGRLAAGRVSPRPL